MSLTFNHEVMEEVLNEYLLPQVTKIDQEGVYPGNMLRKLGEKRAFAVNDPGNHLIQTIQLIESVGKRCATTAFVVWCHTIAIQLVSQSENEYLKQKVLPDLIEGLVIGSTGLSNAMKSFAGMEPILLKGWSTNDGYRISGHLPFVSNLGLDHWFAIIFENEANNRVMAFVPCNVDGLNLVERRNLLGMNGTATYSCQFHDVFIPRDWILAQNASEYVSKVRAEFVLKQVAVPIGLIQTSLESIERFENESEMNRYLPVQSDILKQKIKAVRDQAYGLALNPRDLKAKTPHVMRLRLESTYLAIETTNAEMLHSGAAGYLKDSHPSRRLREAIFFGLVTPTIKHLEKVLR
jgi:alkylation response protein AidB-like acyl-CoA dehydrogenase